MKKKNNTRNILLILGVVMFVVIITGMMGGLQGFSIVNKQVWQPEYLSGSCVPRADNNAELDLGKVDKSGEFFSCNTAESGKWIPVVNGVECNFKVKDEGFTFSVYECPENTLEKNIVNDCEVLRKQISTGSVESQYKIDAGNKIYINPTSFFGLGDLTLKVEYPSYGLVVRQANNFLRATTTNCLLNSLSSDIHTIDAKDMLQVIPDAPFNAVSGASLVRTTQLVSLTDVRGGETIYISRPSYYQLVKEADDGFLYVDSNNEVKDTSIECIPRTTGCSDEAKVIPLIDQSCDEFGGAITSYSPVQGDATKLCKYSCTSGTLSLTNDCIEVQANCPDNKPLWDATTGDCVSNVPKPEPVKELNVRLLIIIGAIIVILALILFKITNTKKGGKK